MKFECKGYADCCRNLKNASKERAEKFASVGVLNLAADPANIALPVFDWEIGKMKDIAKETGRYISVKPLWVAIDHKDRPVVVMWNLDHNDCPFLSGNDCTIYSDRPTICRSFPVTGSGFIQASSGKNDIKIASSTACRCWKEQIGDLGKMTVSDMYKTFYGIFGESYLAALKYDMQFVFVTRVIQDLVDKGKIKPVYVDKKRLEKILQKGSVGFSGFLDTEKILTHEQLVAQLENIDNKARSLVGTL